MKWQPPQCKKIIKLVKHNTNLVTSIREQVFKVKEMISKSTENDETKSNLGKIWVKNNILSSPKWPNPFIWRIKRLKTPTLSTISWCQSRTSPLSFNELGQPKQTQFCINKSPIKVGNPVVKLAQIRASRHSMK